MGEAVQPSLLNSYIPVLVMGVFSVVLVAAFIGLSHLLGPKRPSPQKNAPYECGVTPIGSAREAGHPFRGSPMPDPPAPTPKKTKLNAKATARKRKAGTP